MHRGGSQVSHKHIGRHKYHKRRGEERRTRQEYTPATVNHNGFKREKQPNKVENKMTGISKHIAIIILSANVLNPPKKSN